MCFGQRICLCLLLHFSGCVFTSLAREIFVRDSLAISFMLNRLVYLIYCKCVTAYNGTKIQACSSFIIKATMYMYLTKPLLCLQNVSLNMYSIPIVVQETKRRSQQRGFDFPFFTVTVTFAT